MCVLCGALWTEEHWAEIDADGRDDAPDGVIALEVHVGRRGRRLRDRARRAELVSAVFAGFGLSFQDWEGSSFILRDAKGNSAIAPDLASLWTEAERIMGAPLDPLAPAFLSRLRSALDPLPPSPTAVREGGSAPRPAHGERGWGEGRLGTGAPSAPADLPQ